MSYTFPSVCILYILIATRYVYITLICIISSQPGLKRKMLKNRCNMFIPSNLFNRYCPGGPDSDFEYSTQSYTGYEPTSMRAIRARYDPYLQAKHRLDQVCMYNGVCIYVWRHVCHDCSLP